MNWPRHIDAMDHLRQGINLRSYGQSNPIQEYVAEGLKMFHELNEKIAIDFVSTLLNANIEMKQAPAPQEKPVIDTTKPTPPEEK
jgi:preprotein translocase subunit SecA